MTLRSFSRLILMLLGWTALAGCHPPTLASTVSFTVTVPPETPVDATLFLQGDTPPFSLPLVYQGGNTFSGQVRLPLNQALAAHVQLKAPVDTQGLDAQGALASANFTAHADTQSVDLTVEHWGPATTPPTPQSVFEVIASANTPPDATLWLSGDQPELGKWNGGYVKLAKTVNGHYAAWVSFAPGTELEFKVTRGSWATVEKDAQGADVQNHTFTTSGGFDHILISVGGWADLNTAPPPVHTLTGNIQYLHVKPNDATLKERDLIIWLPPGYDDAGNTSTYPVLYMHDGQNLMDAATSFAGEWQVDETAQDLVTKGEVEPLIIVGIYNTADRIPEYTQTPDPNYPQGGRADVYGDFLVKEVKPLIDGKYRTRPEPEVTGLAGSSLGGLVSMYLGMKYSDTFQRLGVVSPSVWWNKRDILDRVQALPGKLPLIIWEDIGTKEESQPGISETVADSQALHDDLVAKGWTDDTDLKFTVVEGAKHNETYWAQRFPDILRFLYPKVSR